MLILTVILIDSVGTDTDRRWIANGQLTNYIKGMTIGYWCCAMQPIFVLPLNFIHRNLKLHKQHVEALLSEHEKL